MPLPGEYKHIVAWGCLLGSSQAYIIEQQERAAADNAPIDAIFRTRKAPDDPRPNIWKRYTEVTASDTRFVVDNILKSMGVIS